MVGMTALRTFLLGCLLGGSFLSTAGGAEPARLSADIGPRPLAEALAAFGRQTGLQFIYVSRVAETQQSKGTRAGLAAPEALAQLLEGTGLGFEFLNVRTVRIFPAPTVMPTLTAVPAAPRHSAEPGAVSRAPGLEEVLVTGTRGQEPVSRVPIDMVVWTERAMDASHITGIAQIAELTPGVVFGASPGLGPEYTDLVIRGVIPHYGTAVGVYVDDVAIPISRAGTYLLSLPVTFDLERVEILRGPQSVLLGDHAISGAVRFIPNQPSLTAFTNTLRAEVGTTQYGGISYEAGAAVGGPIIRDELGFRVSGWYREQGGYIDRVDAAQPNLTVEADSNRLVNRTVRGALTFAPSGNLQVTPSLMYASIDAHDAFNFFPSISDPARGIFRNGQAFRQPYDQAYYLASLKLIARLGVGELSAVTSYFNNTGNLYTDVDHWGLEQHAYLADVRLSSLDPAAPVTWVAGTFASKDHARHSYRGSTGSDATITDPSQLAGFGQVTAKLTGRISVIAGARIGYSKFDSFDEFNQSPPTFRAHGADPWMTPRFGLSWQVNEDNLVYLTVAKGYGSGGVDPVNGFPGTSFPYSPFPLWSYEIGSKHALLQGRLRVATSVFHIDWNGGQPAPGEGEANAPGRAVSNGAGISGEAQIGDHARAALDVTYTHAYYTQTYTLDGQLLVREGDAVPVSPWNVTVSAEREWPLPNGAAISARIEDSFRSAVDRSFLDNPFFSNPVPGDPSVNVLNLRLAVRRGGFELAAFVSNALGAHPVLYGQSVAVAPTPDFAVTLTPRTLSVSGSWRR